MKKRISISSIVLFCTVFAVLMASCESDVNTSIKHKQNSKIKSDLSDPEKIETIISKTLNTESLNKKDISSVSSLTEYGEKLAKASEDLSKYKKLLAEKKHKEESGESDSYDKEKSDREKAELYFQIGYSQSDVGYFRSRITYVENELWSKSPDDVIVQNYNNTTIKDLKDAIKTFTEAIKLNPHILSYIHRGIAKTRLVIFRVRIEQDSTKKRELFSNNFKTLRQDFNQAIKYNRAIVSDAYFYRGMLHAIESHMNSNNYDRALSNINRAINLSKIATKYHAKYLFMKSLIYMYMGDIKRYCEYKHEAMDLLTGSKPEVCSENDTYKLSKEMFKEILFFHYQKAIETKR